MRWWEETAPSNQSTLANCLSSRTVSQKHRGGGGGEARAQRWGGGGGGEAGAYSRGGGGEARAQRWGGSRAYSREHAMPCMVVMPVMICRKV